MNLSTNYREQLNLLSATGIGLRTLANLQMQSKTLDETFIKDLNNKFTIGIAIVTRNDLDVFQDMLDSLKKAYDKLIDQEFKEKIHLFFQCEPYQPIINVVESIDWINTTVKKNFSYDGYSESSNKVMTEAFDISGSNFVLYLPDDTILSERSLLLLEFYYYRHNNDLSYYFLYNLFSFGITRSDIIKHMKNFSEIQADSEFKNGMVAWCISRSNWNNLKNSWFDIDLPIEDVIDNYASANNMRSLSPVYPYASKNRRSRYIDKWMKCEKYDFIVLDSSNIRPSSIRRFYVTGEQDDSLGLFKKFGCPYMTPNNDRFEPKPCTNLQKK